MHLRRAWLYAYNTNHTDETAFWTKYYMWWLCSREVKKKAPLDPFGKQVKCKHVIGPRGPEGPFKSGGPMIKYRFQNLPFYTM